MTERVLSTRELNRALLARQLLLERSALSITDALEQVGGLQTQYAPSGYVGLWSRLAGFERPMLTQALEERRVVQATMMRVTIHTVSAADYWPLTIAIQDGRVELTPFGRLAPRDQRALEHEAESLAAFHAA